jgi:hypothetical protein
MGKWLLLTTTAVLLPVLACIVIIARNEMSYSELPFQAEHWRASDARERARMVTNLLRSSELLVGKSREEVAGLLGPPDREAAGNWKYDFVPSSGWREYLWIRFDEDTGRVREVITQD